MSITDTANAIRLAINPEVLAELVRLEVGGNPRPGQTRAKTEPSLHPSVSRPVDADRIRWAVDNPLLPVPETVQSEPVAAVEDKPDPSPTEGGLWPPVDGKYATDARGYRVGPMKSLREFEGERFHGKGSDGKIREYYVSGRSVAHGAGFNLVAEWQDIKSDPDLWRPVAGKYGRTRDGRQSRCMHKTSNNGFVGFVGGHSCNWRHSGAHLTNRNLDLIAEWQDETALEMREGAWYERRDGEVLGPIGTRTSRDKYSFICKSTGARYAPDGKSNLTTRNDLIREVPAPDALDAQAIYDNNPDDLVGSVWENDNCSHTLKKFLPHPNYDGKILYECERLHSCSVGGLRENGYRLVRLSSQEAAE